MESISSLELVRSCGLSKSERIVDVGGGDCSLVDHLIQAGHFNLSVLDISEHALNKEDPFTGNLKELYDKTLSFITRNLRKVQIKEGFNSQSELEIPIESIEELLVNALIHKDYFILSSIKVFIFDNRIEIVSPGRLPNTLTIENIKIRTSISKNPILFTNARYILPFVDVGSGIPRAIENSPDLELINDIDREVFVSIIKRPE